MLRISLIICSYNRAALLPRCLAAARKQSLPASDYEIIVVDNGSTDNTKAIVRRWPGVRYLSYPARGLSGARNAGAHAARAPIIAYVDDDAVAHPDLLRELLQTFDDHPGAGCAGGRILLSLPPYLPRWYSQRFAGYFSGFDLGDTGTRRVTDMVEYPFGANVAYRREAFHAVGDFNISLGRVGSGHQGGEELDLEFRLAQHGYEIYYNPAATVEHIILPERVRWSHIARTARASGRNWAYYECKLHKPGQSLLTDVRWLAGTALRVIRARDPWFAYSHHLFYRAKVLRKLRYRLFG